jgi:hypothetical protein
VEHPLTFTEGPLSGQPYPENLPTQIRIALDRDERPARIGEAIAAEGIYTHAGHRYTYTIKRREDA